MAQYHVYISLALDALIYANSIVLRVHLKKLSVVSFRPSEFSQLTNAILKFAQNVCHRKRNSNICSLFVDLVGLGRFIQ